MCFLQKLLLLIKSHGKPVTICTVTLNGEIIYKEIITWWKWK